MKILLMLFLLLFSSLTVAQDNINILMAGDTMLGNDIHKLNKHIFGNVFSELNNNYDIKFFNLEGTLGNLGKDDIIPKCSLEKYCYTFMSPINVLKVFKEIQMIHI